MQSCIGGSVVDINAAVLADDGSVSERNVGNVADALDAVGRDEQSRGACDEFGNKKKELMLLEEKERN